MTTNFERGQRAYDALMYYKKELLIEGGHAIYDEEICDLLTDIKHLCGSHDYDFDACLRMATNNYNTERGYYDSTIARK